MQIRRLIELLNESCSRYRPTKLIIAHIESLQHPQLGHLLGDAPMDLVMADVELSQSQREADSRQIEV